jgi:hypothetical protein
MVVLRTFGSRFDADLAKVVLEANGILATIASDDAGGTQPWMQGPRLRPPASRSCARRGPPQRIVGVTC